MPLPVVGDTMELTQISKLGDALIGHPPVTGANGVFQAKFGNAAWLGNKLVLANQGLRNFWFIPDEPDKASYCVVHSNGAGDAYVLSRNYGGCEYHELYNAATKQLAFIHVYKGSEGLATYTIAPGWTLRSRIQSKGVQARFGNSSVWSVSCIDRSTTPPTVQSKFIGVKGNTPPPVANVGGPGLGTVSNPIVTITHEDSGLNPPP